ncbi:MAG TPA: trypsin-like peptidase domain-containing protein [Thermoanaerobaculia bacterium]|nr:trypsin-like peptidase domain-containing protein [Thermoanaerobaculia bacterium]
MSATRAFLPFVVLAAGLGGSTALAAPPEAAPVARPGAEARRSPIVQAVEKIGPAVVNISAERLVRRRSTPFEQFFDFGFPDRRERGYKTESLGSGVLIDASGIVVTNDHVISGASKIFVTTSDGHELEADVLGSDADNDIAVLKVVSKGLRAVKLGTTADLMIGETAIAVGNPFGLSNTVTQGIVSAIHRTVQGESGRTYSDFIQTDAAINPGNSGGALVNVVGELIGINTAIVGGANTIGFAIPVDRVKRIVDDLLRFGAVKPVWLGLRGTTVSSDRGRASARGIGMKIRSIYPESPAAAAGLARGDVIVSIDGRAVDSREDFETALTSLGPGRQVTLGVKSQGRERTATLTTARAPQDLGLEVLQREVGLTVRGGRSGSLVITSVGAGTPAQKSGLERGDEVAAVNGQKVASLEDLSRAVEQGFGRSGLVLVVVRGGYAYTLSFPLD